eukprot:m.119544 g.119544  ORF g.119544 m.119544 type:complete len:236 (+) comp9558_c0_seq4:781-1488(+)
MLPGRQSCRRRRRGWTSTCDCCAVVIYVNHTSPLPTSLRASGKTHSRWSSGLSPPRFAICWLASRRPLSQVCACRGRCHRRLPRCSCCALGSVRSNIMWRIVGDDVEVKLIDWDTATCLDAQLPSCIADLLETSEIVQTRAAIVERRKQSKGAASREWDVQAIDILVSLEGREADTKEELDQLSCEAAKRLAYSTDIGDESDLYNQTACQRAKTLFMKVAADAVDEQLASDMGNL